ncbi:hypothetical protein TRVL_09944 [Trypanosoma vivax]|nr:hypothetical protein TRVL_09944 [Trypanosoma vivax]
MQSKGPQIKSRNGARAWWSMPSTCGALSACTTHGTTAGHACEKKREEQTQIQSQTLSEKRGSTRETLDNTVHSYATALRAFSLTRQHCSYTPLVCCKVSAGQMHICNNNKI